MLKFGVRKMTRNIDDIKDEWYDAGFKAGYNTAKQEMEIKLKELKWNEAI